MTYANLNPIDYSTASREQKKILYGFIKRYYETATPRDVISGLHKAATNYTGRLCAVITDLSMVAKYSQ